MSLKEMERNAIKYQKELVKLASGELNIMPKGTDDLFEQNMRKSNDMSKM